MNKKLISLGLGVLLSFAMVGCSSSDVEEEPQVEQQVEQQEEVKEMNVPLLDNEHCTVSIVGYYEDKGFGEVGYKVFIENKTDSLMMVNVDNVSVDGMMNDPCWATSVDGGKKAEEIIYWNDIESLDKLVNVEMTVQAYDYDTYESFGEEVVVID